MGKVEARSRKPRKAETVLRELGAVLVAIEDMIQRGTFPYSTTKRAQELLRELRASLRARPARGGR